jgi:3D (Asp-Asp-Asp) domain-containing protein
MSDNINFKDVSPNSTGTVKPVSKNMVEVIKPQIKTISHITGATVKYVNPVAIRKDYIKVSRKYNQKCNRKLAVRTAKVNGSILKLNNAVVSGDVAEDNLQKAVIAKDEKQIPAARERLIRAQKRVNVQKAVLNKNVKREVAAKKKADASKNALLPSDKIKMSIAEERKEKSMPGSKGSGADDGSILGNRQSRSIIGKNGSVQLKNATGKGAYGIKKAVSGSTKAVGKGAKESIKGIARLKAMTDMVQSGDMSTSLVNLGKSGVRLAADIGVQMIRLAVKSAVRLMSMFSAFLFMGGGFPILIVLLITTAAGSVKNHRTDTYTVIEGDYEYVSYSQVKYEKMDGRGETGWCGLTIYASALASMGCSGNGEPVNPYYVRRTGGSEVMSVNGWCKSWVNSHYPEVEYEAVTGYTRDWIDEKLSEGKMVGIYLSPRARWKQNYTGKSYVTNSAHWVLLIAKVGDTEYACIDPANGSADGRYVKAENTDKGSVGILTIDLSSITEAVPSSASSDIRIHSGDSGGTSSPRSASYSPPAFAMGLSGSGAAVQNVVLTQISGDTYKDGMGGKYLSLGSGWTLTAYCPCSICCGDNADGITASGTKATANHTIAVDKNKIALGSTVVINNVVYKAEDTGGAIQSKKIDIYMNTHEEALQFGKKKNQTVYIKIQ